MQVAPSASTYAPAPGDLASPPAPGGAWLFPDQPQDNAGAFADSGPGGFGGQGQPDPQYPYADSTLASTSLFAPTDHTPSTTLALMVQAQTKPLLVTAENAADLGIDFAHTKPLTVTPENAAGLGIDLVSTKPLLVTPENAAGLNLPPQTGSAAPASATAPNASPTEIAALELLLAEPANQEIIAQFGPPLHPLNTDTNVGQGILARFGPDLGARLTQLQEAQDGVRNQYLQALDQATQSSGPDTPGSQWIPGTGQGETAEPGYWKLDPAAFSRHYAQGDSLAQRAFADLHGQDPLVFHEGREGDAHSEPSYHTLGPFRLAQGQPYGSDPSLPDACLLRDYTQLSPEHSADLINKEYLWFDPVNGWSTSADNIQAPAGFLDKALPVAFSALMCMVALPPVGTLLSQAGAGTFVQGAAMGAMGSAISQTVMTGGIDFGNLLRSALTGGIAGSVMQLSGLKDMLGSADLAKSSLAHLGKAGLTGLLQEATGGKFKDGFMNSALASIAQGVGDHLNQQIGELKDISPEQASVLKLLSKAASSALKIAGTDDPAAGFAGEFLSGVLGDGLQGAQGKGQEQGQVRNEGQAQDRPSSDWVKNLGASEVDAQTAQWVEAFANPAALPPSQGIQVASAPIGTVGDAGYFDDSGAYIEPAQLIWADGSTSTPAHSSDGEPMLAETEVRETASADELLINPETGLPDFKYTSSVVNAVNEGLDGIFSGDESNVYGGAAGRDSVKADQGYWASLGGIAGSDLSFADKVSMAWGTTKYYFRNSNEAQGTVQMLGGGLEVAGAVTLSSTGLGATLGLPLAFHGGDNIGTGFNRFMGNGDGATVTYQSIYSLTGSSTLATAIDQGIPFTAGVASVAQGLRMAEDQVLRNTTYRALTSRDAAALNDGLGLTAKNPKGVWTAEDHVRNFNPDTRGGAALNSPWISTARSFEVARGYESGSSITAVNLSKVPNVKVEVWQTAPRSNIYKLSEPYHRSIWAQEVSVYQSVPSQAIYTPFSPMSQVPVYLPMAYGLTLGGTGLMNKNRGS